MGDNGPRGEKGAWKEHPVMIFVVLPLLVLSIAGAFKQFALPAIEAYVDPTRTCTDHRGLNLLLPEQMSAHASSELAPQGSLSYGADKAIDAVTSTAWVEGVRDLGERESLTVSLNEPADVVLVCVLNGYASDADHYERNSRVQDYSTVTDQGKDDGTLDVRVEGYGDFQKLNVKTGTTASLTITIGSARAGATTNGKRADPDTAISEVRIYVG